MALKFVVFDVKLKARFYKSAQISAYSPPQ